MSIFSKIKNFFFKSFDIPPLSFFMNTGMVQPIVTRRDALDLYTSWVFRCIDLRSNGFGAIDFKLYRLKKDGSVEEIIEHELLDLLYRINPGMTKFDFFKLTTVYHDIFGICPWILEGGQNNDIPQNIYLARPEYLKEIRDKTGNVTSYQYWVAQRVYNYTPEEVILVRNYNPKFPQRGLGIIEAVRTPAQHNDYIGQHNTNLLKNGARPSGYLETDKPLGDKETKRLKKEFKDNYEGYENAYKVLLLQGGVKFNPAMIPPSDLEFCQARELNRDEIAGIFGVPKTLLGYNDANRASASTSEYIFAKWTLEPLATKFFEQINEFLVPRYGADLWLWYEPIATEDEQIVNDARNNAWNKWKTTNEIRNEEGLPPVTGGDIIYMPLSNMPTMRNDTNPNPSKEIIQLESKNLNKVNLKTQKYVAKRILNRNVKLRNLAEKAVNTAMDKLIEKKRVIFKIIPEKKTLNLSQEQIDAFYKLRLIDETGLEGLWKKAFVNFFSGQKARFLEKLDANYANIKSIPDELNIDTEQELKATINIINPLVYQTMMAGTQGASQLIGEPSIIDMDFIHSWIQQVSDKTGQSINETTIQAFADTLNEGIAAGEDLSQLKTRVETVFTFATDYRAELIARTETARGVTEAHRQMYEYYGFDDVKWLLAPGACDECQGKADQQWNVKTIEGEIPVHPACKCDATPI